MNQYRDKIMAGALLAVISAYVVAAVFVLIFFSHPKQTQAASDTCYWVGDTNPANWNDASHWDTDSGGAGGDCDGGVVPGADDTVVFDAGNTNEATFDASTTVAAFQMSAGKVSMGNNAYALTTGSLEITGGEFAMIDQGAYRTKVIATSYSQTNGTFNIGDFATVDINGPYTQSAGNFTSGGTFASLDVSGDFDMSGNGSVITNQTHLDGNSANFKASTLSMGSIYFEKPDGQTTTITSDITSSNHFRVESGAINAGTYRVTLTGTSKYLNLYGQTLYDLTIAGSSIFLRESDGSISHNITVNTTKSLSVYADRTLTILDTATTTLTGSGYIETYNTTGKIVFQDSACSNITIGTSNLKGVVRFQALNEDINIPAITVDGRVDIYNAGANSRTATLGTAGSQTIAVRGGSGQNTSSRFTITADGDGNMAIAGNTWNPAVTINNAGYTTAGTGAYIDFTGVGAGTESITAGSGTWTVAGNIDFTGGTLTAGSSSFVLSGDTTATGASQTITSASQSFNNLTVQSTNTNGAVLADILTVGGYLYIAATGASNAILDAATNNVAVNVTGNVDYTGAGAGSESMLLGTNTWTLSGGLDIKDGTITAPTGSTVIMNGATKVIYGNQQTFYNIRFSGNTSIGANENSDYKNFNVNGTLTVDATKTLTFTFRCNIYMNNGATTTIGGTITESASNQTLHLIDSAGANLSTGGTLSAVASFDTVTQDVVIPARTYNGGLTVVNATANNYVAVMGIAPGQTISSSDNHDFTISANGNGNITLDASTYDPAVNVYASGDINKGKIDFTGTGAGSEIINAGDGTWLIDGSIDFTGGTFNANGSTVYSRVDGTQNPTFTMAGSAFYNFIINNPDTANRVFTFADNVTVSNILTMTAIDYAFTVRFTAGITCIANTIDIDGVAGKLITLKSVTDTSPWYFNVAQANPSVSYVSARDSNANGGSEIRASNSTDATGNQHWVFLTTTTVSGTVYTAESKATNIGANKTIGISVKGGPKATVESGAGGTFSFSVGAAAGDEITIFEDGEGAEEMTLFTQAATPVANITGLEAYTNKVVLTHASAGPVTNPLLDYADSTFDDDIKYTITGVNADFVDDFELFIESAKTYTPGGTVDVDDVDINGTFTMGANAVAVHGNWDATGGAFSSSGTVLMDGIVAQTLTSDGDSFYNLEIKTTHASGIILADALHVVNHMYIAADGASNVLLDAATNNVTVTIDETLDFTGGGGGTEDMHMGNGTWTVGGWFEIVDGTIDAGMSTLIHNADTTEHFYGNNQTFYNLTCNNYLTLNSTSNANFKVSHNLTVNGGATLNIPSSRYVYMLNGSTTTIDGTITSSVDSGTLVLEDSAGAGLSTTGTLNSVVRFESKTADVSIPARTYGQGVIYYNNTGSNYSATMGAGSFTFSKWVIITADGNGNAVLSASANDPTINLTNATYGIDFTGTGSGTESLVMGDGTWTVPGSIDFTNGTVTANGSTLVMTGNAKTLTTNAVTLNNYTVQNLTGSAQSVIISGTLNLAGNLNLDAAGVGEANLDCAINNPVVNITGNVDFTGVGAGSEDIHMGTSTWTVGGNIDLTGGTIIASPTIIMNAGDVGNTITSASQHIINLTFNNAAGGWQFIDSANIDGNLTVTASESVGNGVNFNNQAINIEGNFQIDAGKLTMGSSTVNLIGNWSRNGGTIVSNTSNLIMDGAAAQSIISGGQSFHDLTLQNSDATNGVTFVDGATTSGTFTDVTQDSKVTFNDGDTYAFNDINVVGTAGHLINFISSAPGTAWILNITDPTPSADYILVTDSNASGGSQIDATTGGFNGGGNLNWLFAAASIAVSPTSVTLEQGAIQAFTATAIDEQGYNIPTATYNWSLASGGGVITSLGVFTAGTTAGTYANTVTATSGAVNGTASVTVNALPTPSTPASESVPSDNVCVLGSITQIEIQNNNFSLNPGETRTLGVNFLDAAGNSVHRDSVANFKIMPDYNGSYWNIVKGGGRLADENLDTIINNFIAGGTRGSFDSTIAFSACGGALKAYATPTITKQKIVYADIEPESYALEPGESFNFHVSLFDDIQIPIEEKCSYSWSVSDPAGAKIDSPAASNTKVTGNAIGEYSLKVDVSCASGTTSQTSQLAVVKIDENTEYKLASYFPTLTSWEGQKTYVGFIPYIKVNNKWYSRAEVLDYVFSDPSAAKVVGLHPSYPNIPIIESTKAGCYPFLVKALLTRFGKSYEASTSMNIGASGASAPYNKYMPTMGSSTLSYQHMVKVAGEVRLNLNRNNASGQSYSNYNWIYVGKNMNTSWIVNDIRIGSIRPYYNASYLDTTNAEYGYFPNAITTVVDFNGQKRIENWNIWIERGSDKITFSKSVPDTIRVKPNSLFRGVWQGYEYVNWKEKIENPYKIKSFDTNAVSVVNGLDTALLFKSSGTEGTYTDAIVVGTIYGSSSMVNGTERKITVVVDNTITADLCSASAFAEVLPLNSDINLESTPNDGSTSQNKKDNKNLIDIIKEIGETILEAVKKAFEWLNSNPFVPLAASFLLSLPALISILGASAVANTIGSVTKIFSALSVGAVSGKKNRRLGYVYDYVTKKPIKGAKVSAFNTTTNRVIYQTTTNSLGEFVLFLPEGAYYLKIEKTGYGPFKTVSSESQQNFDASRNDGYYDAMYLPSEILNISAGQEDFAHAIAIPLMRPKQHENTFITFLMKLGGLLIKASFYFLIIGTILTIGLLIYDHTNLVNIIVGIYYALIWLLYVYKHYTFFNGTALITDQNGKLVDLALIRVLNNQGKLIQTVVSDHKGRFILNLIKGKYMLHISKANYLSQNLSLTVDNLADINNMKIILK